MTDEEINRDIAEWCGVGPEISFVIKPMTEEKDGTVCCWSEYVKVERYPNFLDDTVGLGLLFKYAMPKIEHYQIGDKVTDKGLHLAVIKYNNKWFEEIGKSPTRALAMAIWKVIKED